MFYATGICYMFCQMHWKIVFRFKDKVNGVFVPKCYGTKLMFFIRVSI